MGTLLNKPKRQFNEVFSFDVKSIASDIKTDAREAGLELKDVIEVLKVLELRRLNKFLVDNGNTFDEQMSGLGKILDRLTELVDSIDRKLRR